jgi:methylamine dehydrogenase accessory protein MauD
MSETLLVSNIVLWCLVIALVVVVIALARQVGLLHERVSPAGALMPTTGPKVGELTNVMDLQDLNGEPVRLGGANAEGRTTLVLWISPTCPVCKALVPTARSLAAHEHFRLVYASDGGKQESHRAYVKTLGIEKYPYVLSQALGVSYAVSKLPFAALIGADGILKSKGLVNTREHLESLVESMETGIQSLQDYVRLADSESDRRLTERAS